MTPQRCLPLNPLVLREQAQGWCWDVMVLSISTGNTDGPTSLLSLLCSLVEMSKDTFSNNLKRKIFFLIYYYIFWFITYRFLSEFVIFWYCFRYSSILVSRPFSGLYQIKLNHIITIHTIDNNCLRVYTWKMNLIWNGYTVNNVNLHRFWHSLWQRISTVSTV